MIVKSRNNTFSWSIYHKDLGNTRWLEFAATTGYTGSAWNSTDPTSTVFSIGNDAGTNNNTTTYVAYCFAEVEGFSKFGSYTGNGSADGPFLYFGFRPAFFLVKRSSASGEGWWIYDDKRDTFNIVDNILEANSSNAEISGGTYPVDFLSNGLKIRGLNALLNTSGATYVFMALASNPFKFALAR